MDNSIFIENYYGCLKCIPTLNKGIIRLRNAIEVLNTEMDGEQLGLFNSFCDYVAFLEGVQKPFFSIADNILSSRYSTLYKHLETNQERYKQLTAKEVFQLFKALGRGTFRSIIDAYNKFPSNIYTSLINSFMADDLASFENALGQYDCTVFTRTLWMFRFIMYGYDGHSTIGNGDRIKNVWLDAPNFEYLFIKLDEENNKCYEHIIKERLVGEGFRLTKKYRQYAALDNIIKSEAYIYYNPTISVKLKNSLSDYIPNKLSENRYDLLSSCSNLANLVPMLALKNSQDNEIATKASESIKERDWDWDWENLHASIFSSYMLSVANDMLTVYYNIKGILDSNENELLLWLMARIFVVERNSIEEMVNHSIFSTKKYEVSIPLNSEITDLARQKTSETGIYLATSPTLPNKYKEKFCEKFAACCENKNNDINRVKYFFWGQSIEENRPLVTKENPLCWKDTSIRFKAFVSYAYSGENKDLPVGLKNSIYEGVRDKNGKNMSLSTADYSRYKSYIENIKKNVESKNQEE